MANFNLNKVVIAGRLTSDPELKTTQMGVSVTSFTIAVNRRFQREGAEQQADFISCTAWRQTAEFITKYFAKGSSICVTGSIQTRKWQDQNGQMRYGTDVVVDEAMFVDAKGEGPSRANAGQSDKQGAYVPENYGAPSFGNQNGSVPKFEDIADEDGLPF